MPRLSVLMSAYKSGDTIGAAVRSTLRALPRDSELVVVVDGPDAATETALSEVRDTRLTVRVDPENKGLSRQLQVLVETTDSELVARMDSDDFCLPWRFVASVAALRCNDFVFTSGIRFGAGLPRPSYPAPLNAQEVALGLLFYNPLFHPSMVATRAALTEVGGYRPLRYGEDYELWLRAAAAGKRLVKIAPPSIAYRLSPGQMSAASGADERLLSEPEVVEARIALASRLGLGEAIDDHGRLHLDDAAREDLLTRVSRVNRGHLRRQFADSQLLSRA